MVLQPERRLELRQVPEPVLGGPGEVLLRVTTAAICASDLHAKQGLIPGVRPGTVMGHEFVGVVVQKGQAVTRFQPGDRVAAPAAVWCGVCPACRRGEAQYCQKGGIWGAGDIFGPGLDGAQTGLVRVPYADNCLCPIPDSVSDEQAVFVGDVLSTGFHAALQARIRPGDLVVVLGCGPIGLASLICAWQFGPRQVLAVDTLDNRLALARRYGATALDASQGRVAEQVRQASQGAGADVVIEAIGNPDTFLLALDLARRGGSVSVVGMFSQKVNFPLGKMAAHGLNLSMGLGSLLHMERLMGLLVCGRLDLQPLVSHVFGLEQALEAYDLFENHKDQCLKVLLKP
ncbi:MAG: alcohol dehydrogenase catalytic domain-containing protein [Pseudomonadota bacterium]